MKKVIKFFVFAIFITIIIGGFWGYQFYQKRFDNNVQKTGFVLIPTNASFQQILDSIAPFVKDLNTFEEVALSKHLDRYHHAGRYQVKKAMNNTSLVNMIKAGNQTANQFRIKDFDNVYQMMGRVARKTEIDSIAFIKGLDAIAHKKGLKNAEDLKLYFFIDTYHFFWTVKPEDFFDTFEKQYNNFWSPDRVAKEKQLGLDRNQIYALASIVYKESGGRPDEQKTIAGLYLNRYKKGMKLQSDPTVIYAINQANNFSRTIKRVYYKDLKTPSLYNTYANVGIPPGPICVVDKNAVDAVLNAEKNDYLFMVADPQRIGYHKFTKSDLEHAKNAKAYQNWLNQNKIK